jgi:hypothetical protein
MTSPSSAGGLPPAPEESRRILPEPEKPTLAGPPIPSSSVNAAHDRSVVATPSWEPDQTPENIDATLNLLPGLGNTGADGNSANEPGTPAAVVNGAKSGAELLRRLSLVDARPPVPSDASPQQAHPGLHLTGRVISATFCIPHKLGFRPNSEDPWVRSPPFLAFF